MSKTITCYDNVIDSRDVIARIEELTEELTFDLEDADSVMTINNVDAAAVEELAALLKLQEEAEGYAPGWRHGATLIREDYFPKYAEQLADDIGAIKRDAAWPTNHIDWDAAAEELAVDYTAVGFSGCTYYVR